MRLKKCIVSIVLLTLIFGLTVVAGCGSENTNGDNENKEGDPASTSVLIDLYFVNSQYANTGDENLDHYLVDTREYKVEDGDNQWLDILKGLQDVDLDEAETAVTKNVLFEDVYVSKDDESLMIVDLADALSGGSMQEGFFIGQIVKTVIKNGHIFQESSQVDKVQFLVKGEKVESLMGHFDASDPFTDEAE